MNNKLLRAVLLAGLFAASMLYLGTARAGNFNWSIQWVIPAPQHGHGHNHGYNPEWWIAQEKGIELDVYHHNICENYYRSFGCNRRGRNCRVLPPQDCVQGHLVPRRFQGHSHHRHDWRCYNTHWHGQLSHTHHWNGHHTLNEYNR